MSLLPSHPNPTQTTLNPRLQRAAGSPQCAIDFEGSGQQVLSTPGLKEDSRKMTSLLVPCSSNESPQGCSTAGMPDGPQLHFPESPLACHGQLTAKITLANGGRCWLSGSWEGCNRPWPPRLRCKQFSPSAGAGLQIKVLSVNKRLLPQCPTLTRLRGKKEIRRQQENLIADL